MDTSVPRLSEIHMQMSIHSEQHKCNHYILSFDGVIVIPRYSYSEGLGLVLGGSEPLTPEDYMQKTDSELDSDLGNEIIQFHLQSLDGKLTFRAGHFVKPDSKCALTFLLDRCKTIVTQFYSREHCIILGFCCDGDLAAMGLDISLDSWTTERYGTPFFSFRDPSHSLIKAPRNAMLGRNLQPGEYVFGMNELIDLCKANPCLSFVKDSWLNPADIMRMTPVLGITSKEVQDALLNLDGEYTKENKELASEISEFLRQIRRSYDAFMPSDHIDIESGKQVRQMMSEKEALRALYGKNSPNESLQQDNLLSYLSSWNNKGQNNLASQTTKHIMTTVFSLYKLVQYLRQNNIDYELCRSILSTLSVELSFSITRSHQTYFHAADYSRLSGRTEYDQRLMLTRSEVRGFTLPSDRKQQSACYNTCDIKYSTLPDLTKKVPEKKEV